MELSWRGGIRSLPVPSAGNAEKIIGSPEIGNLDSEFFFIASCHLPPPFRMKSSLEIRILSFASVLLFVAFAVNTLLNIDAFQQACRDSLLLRCSHLGEQIAGRFDTGFPQSLHGESVRMLAKDPEIDTFLITGPSGEALFANDEALLTLDTGNALKRFSVDAALYHHPPVGEIYLVTVPVHSAQGVYRGALHLGFSHQVLTAMSRPAMNRSLWFLAIGLPLFATLSAFFLRRHLISPLCRLSAVAREISQGQFPLDSPSPAVRELSDLGTGLQQMATSLKRRDEAILEGYKELEQTHQLLQRSYQEQEKTSAELKRSQTMFLTLFENATDAIVISDHDDKIVLFNRQAEEFFGIARDRVIGRNLLKSLDMLRGVRGQEEIYREFLKTGTYESELEYFRPGQFGATIGWIRATVARDPEGRHWVQAIIRDVTHERQVKENLERSTRELERLNTMKDSFLGLASHELKTPLTVIVGYADLIQTDKASSLDETTLTMVRNISEAADRLTRIVRDMVDVSRLDAQRLPLDLRPADLNDFIRAVASDHQPFLELRRQQLTLHLAPELPAVACDALRLAQAIGNLIGNAIKFTPDGGGIALETFFLPDEGQVEIVIRDSGIGIAEKDQCHIFDKFYEAGLIEEHFTGKYDFKGKGTGLGLTIAKGIIEMHGGSIRVESPGYDPERCPGSAFHIRLPASSR